MKRKIAIVGSRSFTDYWKLLSVMETYFETDLITDIISGGAGGADSLGKRFAKENPHIQYTEHPAQWDLYGKGAGFRRNHDIVNDANMVVAFWDGKSPGTRHTIGIAFNARKDVLVIAV